ncbi:helix-turn-helix domain-containing protein [Actinotignum urinale]|uniref:Helix-turn-helix domain-containing protein n=2 Tax=Actinotignum urinale TaxID=190146 RepID=A0AAW9HXP9_9ACTO|nr:helix-turn-helix domain-containing protein [Actinotignum urinale]MDY5129400.1 helix-turn-helix domain-containing protein [Actinotignum urinale]MDY5132939.1 helix-turn-helix domain-containing protein [Actinotignum urinale]MDY5151567.1 helix-turn-helix domain-containing protein [Actinotignum urinale]MDY5155215.1 helix-turn-helix domain-containing protein [Actinotignum urinale]MDY5161079.1 helix-turn-helix domain-containing protein [Actinotignum urinale]
MSHMSLPSQPQFYTVAEVAQIARVSKMTVYRMVHAGDLPAVRVGSSYRVPAPAVQELLGGSSASEQVRRVIGE